MLEGGYDLNTIQEGTKEILLQLSGKGREPGINAEASQGTKKELEPILNHLKKHWKI